MGGLAARSRTSPLARKMCYIPAQRGTLVVAVQPVVLPEDLEPPSTAGVSPARALQGSGSIIRPGWARVLPVVVMTSAIGSSGSRPRGSVIQRYGCLTRG